VKRPVSTTSARSRGRAVGTAAFLLLWACRADRAPREAPRPSREVASHVVAPPGTTLEQACTPTGPELCFNAIDDNCNGVIDEGCGEETGVLQLTIAWGASQADVNLALETPDHVRVRDPRTPPTASGGCALDRDCPRSDACRGQNVENIHCDALEPPPGHYTAEISLGQLNGADSPVKVRFGARLGGRTLGFDLELSPEDPKKTFSFDVP
jgi:tRNA (guanosine-2'-O-)-methyltransferase